MADSDLTGSRLALDTEQKLKVIRDILGGTSALRIPRFIIEMTEAQPRAKGGQGVVVIGTLILPEAFKKQWPFKEQWPEPVTVAVKKFLWNRDDAEESARFFKSFVNEISLMSSLSHPNVIRLVGFVEDVEKGDAWMILPWEKNGNVREFLQSGDWDIPERISLIHDTAKGLEYLHSQDPPICHGDLKSLNILVNSGYRAVITDFGSARIRRNVMPEKESAGAPVRDDEATGQSRSTSPNVKFNPSTMELTLTGPKFTLRWTAPEVLNNGIQDLPSDMWALGWVCWEIVTGKIPFQDLHIESIIIIHTINGKLPAIREDANLSHVLTLCSLMSDCWLLEPVKRIHAPTFRLKVGLMPQSPSSSVVDGQKVRSARLLLELGRTCEFQSDRAMAEVHYRAALDVATQSKNDEAKAFALNCLGSIYTSCREAEEAFTEAHKIHLRLGNDLGAADALNGLGDAYRGQFRYREAEEAFKEAHEIHSRTGGGDIGAANALEGLGDIYSYQMRYLEAERVFVQTHEIQTRLGNDLGAANALDGLGRIYYAQKRNQEAERALVEGREIYSRIGNDSGTANALVGLGKIHLAQLRYEEAEQAFMEAHEIHSRAGYGQGIGIALTGLGNTYRAQSRTSEAEKAFNDALDVQSRIGDEPEAGNTLRSLAKHFGELGRYDDAEASYRRALISHERANDGDGRAITLLSLGNSYYTQGRYPEAEEVVTEALAIYISLANEKGQGVALVLLCSIFKAQSKHNEEKEALFQAEAVLARTGNETAHAETLDQLGQFHLVEGTYNEAEECYRLAQAIYSSMGNFRGEAAELLSIARLYMSQGRHNEAEECFAEARVAYASVSDEKGEAVALEGLTATCALQRKLVDAKAACVEARQIYAQMGRPMSEACAIMWQALQILSGNSS